ncbi:MAG TPA: hypothetical protein VIX63_16590 [Vicinamibacterales bacterium]
MMKVFLAAGMATSLFVSMRAQAITMNDLGERYVRLVLALGQHDTDYVDAYYGPPQWKQDVEAEKLPLAELMPRATALTRDLAAATPPAGAEELVRLRHRYVSRQLEALLARAAMLTGRKPGFDAESKALYDAVAPRHTEAEFTKVLAELDVKLPGPGPLLDRLDAFRNRFVIPKEKLDATFKAAIGGCRARTLQHITLPAGESFTVEYVTGKSWSGYNWYQGNYRSLIQVNTDLPIYADRAIDLACHEGYPGHHVYNVLLEKNLVRDRGWMEFSVYPLFSPQSLIAEGTANFGIEVAFPRAERLEFERRVIFPAAGLDPAGAAQYYAVLALVDRLSYAGNEAARRYLDGEIDARAAADWLVNYGLSSRPRAEQRVRFIDQYRSYVINYNLGKDMVARHIESRGGTAADPQRRWVEFERLLSSPRLPSDLATR